MKQQILYSRPMRLTIPVIAGTAAPAIIRIQSVLKLPLRFRLAFR